MTPLEHIAGLIDPSYSAPIRRAVALGILEKHAHELAEKIRERCSCGLPQHCVCTVELGDAADSIDPEKESNDPQ